MDFFTSPEYCNYTKHPSLNNSFILSYFCHTCKLRICLECIEKHNQIFSTHNIEKITTDLQKLKISLEQIENDKNLSHLNEKEEENIGNTMFNNFAGMLRNINNTYISTFEEFCKKSDEYKKNKKDIENKLGNTDINIDEEIKNIEKDRKDLYDKQQMMIDLLNSVDYLLNINKIQKSSNQISKTESLPFININVNKETKVENNNGTKNNNKEMKSNEIKKENNNTNYKIFGVQRFSNNTNNEEKLINNKTPIKKQFKNTKYYPDNKLSKSSFIPNINNSKQFNISPQSNPKLKKSSVYVNRKIQREKAKDKDYEYKESQFSFENDPNKKRKTQDINDNPNQNNNSDKDSNKNQIIFQQVNNYKTNVNNYYINNNIINNEVQNENNNYLCIFNIGLNKEGETSLSVVEINGNTFSNKTFYPKDIRHTVPFLHSDKFPFLCCRLININNKAFIVGGRSFLDTNGMGNSFVFRINYINEKKDTGGEIITFPLKNTIYMHQSHHLIYSELYNSIFVLSGKDQRKCEYGILDKEKNLITEWKEMAPLHTPRENVLCFLFNEKYIFLFGGKISWDNYDYYKYDYDVIDISSIFNNGVQKWKSYIFNINKYNETIFKVKIAGIIEASNNIYVLGGYGYGLGNNLNWKISFIDDKEGQDDICYKKIESIVNLKSNSVNKCLGILSFYGQQKFIKYQDKFHNINIQGIYLRFQKSQLDENM